MSAIALQQVTTSAIATTTGDTKALSVVESLEQSTHPANVDVSAGNRVKLDGTLGRWVLAAVNDTGTYLALRTVKAGETVTGLKRGIVDGLNVSALDYNAPIFTNGTGLLDTATSTNAVVCAKVIAAHSQTRGNSPDKLARVDMP